MSVHHYLGSVRPGRGLGVSRMSEPGFLEAFGAMVEFEPVPGTLNLMLADDLDDGVLDRHLPAEALGPSWGSAMGQDGYWWAPVRIAHRYRGIAFQAEEPGYPRNLVEIVSSVRLRDALEVDDGDDVEIEFRTGAATA